MESAEISELLLRACHDLKTPLRGIRAPAELLLRNAGAGQADFETRLGFVIDSACRIELLIDGLSHYAIAMTIQEGSFRKIRMDVVLRLTLSKIGKELRERQASVTYDSLPSVRGDPDRLVELFENLLLNAIRHGGACSPIIRVTAKREGEDWLFAVQDNGPGIEAAYLQRIFKPFERLRGKDSAGPGLGLTISREIVERHEGRIWAESAAGSGSTFFFTLPATPSGE